MSLRNVNNPWLTDVIDTPAGDSTISTACSFAIPDDSAGYCEIRASLRAAATAANAYIVFPFRNVAGVLTLLTAMPVIAISGDAGLLAAVLDATQAGTTFQPRIKGIGGTPIEWLLDCRYTLN